MSNCVTTIPFGGSHGHLKKYNDPNVTLPSEHAQNLITSYISTTFDAKRLSPESESEVVQSCLTLATP